MTCLNCEKMQLTNKELHRRLQKAESKAAQIFKLHNPMLAELESSANTLKDCAGKLRMLYKKEWRQFQTDDPLFKEKYELYITKHDMFNRFKSWITKGK